MEAVDQSESDGGSGFYWIPQWRAILPHMSAIVVALLTRFFHMTLAFQLGFVCVALAITTDWSRSRSRTMERETKERQPMERETKERQPENNKGSKKKKKPENNKGSKKKKCIMGREISKLEKIKEANRINTDPEKVFGASVVTYVNDNSKGVSKITFEDHRKTTARCIEGLKAKEAKDYYHFTSEVKHDSVLSPSLVTFNEEKGDWILFYPKFNCYINDWDLKKEIPDSTARQMWWLKSIKRILKSIASTHKQKLTHSGLDRHSNYVIQDGELKLINIKSQNATMSEASMRNDFIQFRDFLRERLPKTWRDLNLFLDFFDKPIEFESYVEKLIRHPFLMSSQKRLRYFFRIGQAFEQNIISKQHFKKTFQDGPFSEYMGWNSTTMYDRMSQDLRATIDYGKSHWITYEGHLLDTLVMFLRNVYVHRANSGKYEVLDREVNRLYPGFLSKLHELLPSKEELNRPTVQMQAEAEGEAGQVQA